MPGPFPPLFRMAAQQGPLATLGGLPGRRIVRLLSVLAILGAIIVAAAPPAAYFFGARARLQGALEASARLHAAEIGDLARRNPEFWDFRELRVDAPLGGAAGSAVEERLSVFDAEGRLILVSGAAEALRSPVLSQRAPLREGDAIVGETEASRSLYPAVATTMAILLGSGLLGILVLLVLRTVPLRLLQHALGRAAYFAAHDPLTGLPNRVSFNERLRQGVALARRRDHSLAVLCLDLDRFKDINDTFGHPAGDRLLKEVAVRLVGCLRESDVLARLGGDEFAVVQIGAQQPRDAQALAQRMIEALAPPIDLGGSLASVGTTIGIALARDESGRPLDADQLLVDADLALYRAKLVGRGAWRFFEPEMNQEARLRRELEQDLRLALAESDFRLHFQPQVDLFRGRLIGAEALLRWDRPGHGPVPPALFVEVAEESGLITGIGAWVLEEACRQAAAWPSMVSVAVNVSPAQFRLGNLARTVRSALEASGLPPGRLELEITEGVLFNNTEDAQRQFREIRALGVRIAMDDFGTGFSSLGYLHSFPCDKIKIDRSFIAKLGQSESSEAIVRAILGMARAFRVRVVAEGVETAEQASFLMNEGCHEAQGYYFGRPVSGDAFLSDLLDGGHRAPHGTCIGQVRGTYDDRPTALPIAEVGGD
ncbi:EAL domain-containing protein [Roseomonas hellenica]|uniref:EAL domain-containing protein n=1 Tax=Plastoroseomonas hellenica TaxID=2687306 RepID=A0ABS5F5C8_9PROT|nr:EAL domain-containing protein [Plastoroseomonas hellenica]